MSTKMVQRVITHDGSVGAHQLMVSVAQQLREIGVDAKSTVLANGTAALVVNVYEHHGVTIGSCQVCGK